MPIYDASTRDAEEALEAIEKRRAGGLLDALGVADDAIAGVRRDGDRFVAADIRRYDHVTIEADRILAAPRAAIVTREVTMAIACAIERLERFHRPQIVTGYRLPDRQSSRGSDVREGDLIHRVRPLRRVGIYVPGGGAAYVSTLLMCAIPARLAGVEEIVVATPPAAAGRDELHYVCRLLGVGEIYRAGGASAIAALALGTETLARVDKIVGPGNRFVTAAKMRLFGAAGIDMTAGPTELVVIADETADPDLVSADLLAQAEHGDDSGVICITTSRAFARRMPERAVTIVVPNIREALRLADRIGPEHLSIQTRDAEDVAEQVENCGAIFRGPFSPVAAGDYIAGPNHVLPTGGAARFFSPLGVYDFIKRTNIIALQARSLAEIAPHAEVLARLEGLPMHAASLSAAATYAGEAAGAPRRLRI